MVIFPGLSTTWVKVKVPSLLFVISSSISESRTCFWSLTGSHVRYLEMLQWLLILITYNVLLIAFSTVTFIVVLVVITAGVILIAKRVYYIILETFLRIIIDLIEVHIIE